MSWTKFYMELRDSGYSEREALEIIHQEQVKQGLDYGSKPEQSQEH